MTFQISFWTRVRAAWKGFRGESIREMVSRELNALYTDHAKFKFAVGDEVHKLGGDYTFQGWIVSRWTKRGNPNAIRYDVENPEGLVHIMNEKQLMAGWPEFYSDRDVP